MVGLIGGKGAANRRLDSFFAYDKLLADPAETAREVWVNGPYAYDNADKYNPQNEPDLIAPYTYLSPGQPWKTADVVHAALTLFTDAPTGMTGNDDLGTMSAWMVLSSIGVFPVRPGTDTWGLSTPAFERVDIGLDRRYCPRGSFSRLSPDRPEARTPAPSTHEGAGVRGCRSQVGGGGSMASATVSKTGNALSRPSTPMSRAMNGDGVASRIRGPSKDCPWSSMFTVVESANDTAESSTTTGACPSCAAFSSAVPRTPMLSISRSPVRASTRAPRSWRGTIRKALSPLGDGSTEGTSGCTR